MPQHVFEAVIGIIWLMIVHLIGRKNRKAHRAKLLWGEGLLRAGQAAYILHFSPAEYVLKGGDIR